MITQRQSNKHYSAPAEQKHEANFVAAGGIDVTKVITNNITVVNSTNFELGKDGVFTLRKPLIFKNNFSESYIQCHYSYLKDYIVVLYTNRIAVYSVGAYGTPDTELDYLDYKISYEGEDCLLKRINKAVRRPNGSPLNSAQLAQRKLATGLFDFTESKILNTPSSTIITGVKVIHTALQDFPEIYSNLIKTTNEYFSYRNLKINLEKKELVILEPEINHLNSEAPILNPNTTLPEAYAFHDNYNAGAISILGCIPYVCYNTSNEEYIDFTNTSFIKDTTIETLVSNVAHNNMVFKPVGSLPENASYSIVLKAFMNIKRNPTTVYLGIWEKSYNGIDWKEIPEFINSGTLYSFRILDDTKIVTEITSNDTASYLTKRFKILNIDSDEDSIGNRIDCLCLKDFDGATYRFSIYAATNLISFNSIYKDATITISYIGDISNQYPLSPICMQSNLAVVPTFRILHDTTIGGNCEKTFSISFNFDELTQELQNSFESKTFTIKVYSSNGTEIYTTDLEYTKTVSATGVTLVATRANDFFTGTAKKLYGFINSSIYAVKIYMNIDVSGNTVPLLYAQAKFIFNDVLRISSTLTDAYKITRVLNLGTALGNSNGYLSINSSDNFSMYDNLKTEVLKSTETNKLFYPKLTPYVTFNMYQYLLDTPNLKDYFRKPFPEIDSSFLSAYLHSHIEDIKTYMIDENGHSTDIAITAAGEHHFTSDITILLDTFSRNLLNAINVENSTVTLFNSCIVDIFTSTTLIPGPGGSILTVDIIHTLHMQITCKGVYKLYLYLSTSNGIEHRSSPDNPDYFGRTTSTHPAPVIKSKNADNTDILLPLTLKFGYVFANTSTLNVKDTGCLLCNIMEQAYFILNNSTENYDASDNVLACTDDSKLPTYAQIIASAQAMRCVIDVSEYPFEYLMYKGSSASDFSWFNATSTELFVDPTKAKYQANDSTKNLGTVYDTCNIITLDDCGASTIELKTQIASYMYTLTFDKLSPLENEYGNTTIGEKLYHKKVIYTYGLNSFKNCIFPTEVDSTTAPLFNVIDLDVTSDSLVTTLIPWRDYLIAATTSGVYLISKGSAGYTSKIVNTFIGIPFNDRRTCKSILNGIIFKSGCKIYTLQPSLYSSDDTILNIADISKPIAPYLESTTNDNFAFSTEEAYYLFLPTSSNTVCLKYTYATKTWVKFEYPTILKDFDLLSVNDIRLYDVAGREFYFNHDLSEEIFNVIKDLNADFENTEEDESLLDVRCQIPYGDYFGTASQLAAFGSTSWFNTCLAPIHFMLDSGQKVDTLGYTRQFVESKLLLATLHSKDCFPFNLEIYVDGREQHLTFNVNSDSAVWKTTLEDAGTLNTDFTSDNSNIINVMRQMYLRYSSKGKSIRHIIFGDSCYNFKLYGVYYRYKLLNFKK